MLNIALHYQSVLKLEILHEYFNTQMPNGTFSIVPTEQTRVLCERMGLVIREDGQNLTLVFDKEKDDAMLYFLENIEEVKFSFYIYSENTLFKNFTNYPLVNQNFIYYFSSQNIENDKSNPTYTNSLKLVENLLELKQDSIIIKPKTETFLQNILEEKLLIGNDTNQNSSNFDTNKLEEGKYTVLEKNKRTKEFLYLRPRIKRNPIAFLDMVFGEKERKKLGDAIREREKMRAFSYRINFATRHTFWRYFIVPKYKNSSKHLLIETQDKAIQFANPKETTLPNTSTQAYMFEANQSLALQQRYAHDFQLIKTKDSKGKSVRQALEKLPYPNIDTLRPASKEADAKTFSDIIVYI